MPTATIRAQRVLPHSPARVWRALTDPAQMGRWLMKNDFQPVLGHAFTFDTGGWGTTACVVLALEPERLLTISWKNPPLDTTVTWRLEPEGTGTRLTIEHAGFDLEHPMQKMAFENMGRGWETKIFDQIVAAADEV